MKTISRLILTFVFCTVALIASAQQYPQKNINGQMFYEYTMEKAEGFFALYRKFGVTEAEVKKYNPETENGLKLGQKVLIPIQQDAAKEAVTKNNNLTFLEHTVLKKQTTYSLSKMYNVAIDSIYKYNPDARITLKEGSIVKIPVYKNNNVNTSVVASNVENENEKTDKNNAHKKEQRTIQLDGTDAFHTVRAGETLFSIAQTYNITYAELMKMNPQIKGNNISEGDILKVLPFGMSSENEMDSQLKSYADSLGRPLRIAYLLPFMLDKEGLDAAAGKFYEFYQGALLAIDSLKKQGVSINIYTYDTDRSDDKIQKVLASPELKTMDFIIGPAYTTHVKAVSTFAKANNIRLIVPFSLHPDETLINPNIFQCNIGGTLFEDEMINRFPRDFAGKNIILLQFNSKATQTDNFTKKLTAELDTLGVPYKKVTYLSSNISQIENLMVDNKENLLVILNKNHAELLSAMPVLNNIKKTFSIFGFSEWLQMSKTLEEILSHDTYMYSQFKVDYDDENIKRFMQKYTKAFDNDISKTIPHYNLLGYDITYYFVEAALLNQELQQTMFNKHIRMLQNEFHFCKISESGGYINKSVFLTTYKN